MVGTGTVVGVGGVVVGGVVVVGETTSLGGAGGGGATIDVVVTGETSGPAPAFAPLTTSPVRPSAVSARTASG